MKFSKIIFTIIFLAGIFSFLGYGISSAAARERGNIEAFEGADCWFDSPIPMIPGPEFQCGYVTVPEHHNHEDGRVIRIPVAILKASSEAPRPDPLFLAQGGPGGDAFEIFPILIGQSADQLNRDIVIFNQRGTRYAEPSLLCTESFDASAEILTLTQEQADARSLEALSACYKRLKGEGIDLSAYNSLENAADIDAIREALGYEEYNFYGVSYGTLLGLHLMREHPQNLRSVILDGVVPPNINFIPQIAANTDRVFTKIIEACNNDEICAGDYPNLEERFFDLVQSLNESPQTISIVDPENGKSVIAFLNGDVLVDVLFQAFYLPDSYATFPKLVANLEDGDFTFIRGIWPLFAFDRTISEGMYFSVICAEDADFTLSEANIEGIRPYFAQGINSDLQTYLDACNLWQVDQLPGTVDDAVESEIPTLLFSGYYDPITPPNFADVVASTLENSYTYVEPTGSHGVAFDNPCTMDVLRQFLENPEKSPDMSCQSESIPTDFIAPDALSFPFLGEVNQLSNAMWKQIGLASLFLVGVLSSFFVLPLIWLIGVIRKQDQENRAANKTSRHLKWLGGIISLLFGFLALVFVAGATFFTVQALFNGLASIFTLSGAAAPLFAIPFVLIGLAILLSLIVFEGWRKNAWSIWLKIYFSFLAICAIGYVFVLGLGGMMSVLL